MKRAGRWDGVILDEQVFVPGLHALSFVGFAPTLVSEPPALARACDGAL